MKRIIILCMAVLVGLSAMFACKKVDTEGSNRVPVEGVSLDQKEVTLVIGGELTLHATVTPSNATKTDVSWSSSAPAVATVDASGKVSAKSIGSATITVKTLSGNRTDECKVTVVKESVPVTGVSLGPDDVVLSIGGTQQLTVTLKPSNATNHKVTWSSDAEDVATVKNGLVTGKARGTAHITVKTEDGGFEASVPVRVVQPYSAITITSPDTSDSHYDSGTQKYTYLVGETFQLVASGVPAEADDEIVYAIYGWSSDGYKKYYDIDAAGKVTAIGAHTGCTVQAYAKSDRYNVYAKFTFDVAPKVSSFELKPDASACAVKINNGSARNTGCIGVGATQVFNVTVNPSDAPKDLSIQSQSGSATFSLTDGKLTVKVPSTATASTKSSKKTASVVLKGAGGYTQTFTFQITKYDPYQVKEGDVIAKDGTIGDGGYRGNQIFEDPVYKISKVNCVIAHLGDEHTTEDPLWNTYKPSPALTDNLGKGHHGIAIPASITKLYRSSETGGEYYYTNSSNNNYIEDSGNLPSWVKTTDRKALLRSNSLKHSAYMNTCCHVYTNAGRGDNYEILPFNFFVDDTTKKPSKDAGESNKMESSSYATFWGAYSSIDNGFNASSYSQEPTKGTLLSPWLLPTIADFVSVFTNMSASDIPANFNDYNNYGVSLVEDKIDILEQSVYYYTGVRPDYDNTPWWLANETGQNKFVQGKISDGGVKVWIYRNVPHKDDSKKAYVLPIRYF